MNTKTLQIWLWDGDNPDSAASGAEELEGRTTIPPKGKSSLAANIILQAPFELLAISITLFLAALGSYLGLLLATSIRVSKGWDSNFAVLSAFLATAVFSLVVFGQAMGQKDHEMAKNRTLLKSTETRCAMHTEPVNNPGTTC